MEHLVCAVVKTVVVVGLLAAIACILIYVCGLSVGWVVVGVLSVAVVCALCDWACLAWCWSGERYSRSHSYRQVSPDGVHPTIDFKNLDTP